MTTIENNANWTNFIKAYENLPELWNPKCEAYKNKIRRTAAYEKLTKVYHRNIDKNASVETIKARIRNMRIVYKRELKKKIECERKGESYEPNLWYFNHFDFLRELEMPEKGSTVLNSDEEERACVSMTPFKSAHSKRPPTTYEKNEFLRKASIFMDSLNRKKERDEADIYGDGWTHEYRKLTPEQKLFAKKAIDEILILGQLDKLTLNSVRSGTSPVYNAKIYSPQVYHEEDEMD